MSQQAPVIEHTIDLGTDVKLHFLVKRAQGNVSTPTLLLLHYWGGSNRTYHDMIDRLDFNIVAPSLRGWGKSLGPARDDAYSIENYAGDILELLNWLQKNMPAILQHGVVLVGHSLGAKVAQLLLTKPGVQPLIGALVLIAPASIAAWALESEEMREQQIHAYDSIESAKFVMINLLSATPTSLSNEEATLLAQDAVAGNSFARLAWPRYGMSEDYADDFKTAMSTSFTGLPALVLAGDLDRVETRARIQVTIDILQSAGAKVDCTVLQGVGHLIPVEAPDVLAKAIMSFCRSLSVP